MQGTQELVPGTNAALHFDVMGEIMRLLAPYQVGGVEIGPRTVISEGLAIDSLAIMDVIMELEDRFDITIPMNVVAEIDTIDQLADTVLTLSARR